MDERQVGRTGHSGADRGPGGRVAAHRVEGAQQAKRCRSGNPPQIEALLDQHNYVRRVGRLAQSAGLIDLVFDGLDTPWVLEVLGGVEDGLRGSGRAVVVTGDHSDPAAAKAWLENLSVRPSDGVIMAVTELTDRQRSQLDSLGLPFVVIDPVGQLDPNVMSVGAANYTGGLAATEHLLSLGHRRIAMIGGPPHMLFSRARNDAYRSALLKRRHPDRPGTDHDRRLPYRGRLPPGNPAICAARTADRDLRSERSASHRRVRRGQGLWPVDPR